ncbi:MAG: helix-turn-helix domain-containing protein [Polyangiales bacterium]
MSDEARSRIVDAALRVLETRGAKGFGQVRVAREAGLQQGHLTYYFPHKRDLVTAVLARLSAAARGEFDRVVAARAALPPEEGRRLLSELVRMLLRDRRRARILVAMLAEADEDDGVRAALVEFLHEQRRALAVILGRDADDPQVHLALAMLRGLGIEHLLAPVSDAELDALIIRFRAWFSSTADPPAKSAP